MKRIIQSETGFTLIEVLMAMVILTIAILSLYSLQIRSVQGNFKARLLTTESVLNTDRIEQLIAKAYGDIELRDRDGDGTNKDIDGDGVDGTGDNFGLDDKTIATADAFSLSPDGLYTIFWNVAVDLPAENLKTISVWVQDNNRSKSVPILFQYIKDDLI